MSTMAYVDNNSDTTGVGRHHSSKMHDQTELSFQTEKPIHPKSAEALCTSTTSPYQEGDIGHDSPAILLPSPCPSDHASPHTTVLTPPGVSYSDGGSPRQTIMPTPPSAVYSEADRLPHTTVLTPPSVVYSDEDSRPHTTVLSPLRVLYSDGGSPPADQYDNQHYYEGGAEAQPSPDSVGQITMPKPVSATPLLPPCRVCGEKASGFHYGVNTCEACKVRF